MQQTPSHSALQTKRSAIAPYFMPLRLSIIGFIFIVFGLIFAAHGSDKNPANYEIGGLLIVIAFAAWAIVVFRLLARLLRYFAKGSSKPSASATPVTAVPHKKRPWGWVATISIIALLMIIYKPVSDQMILSNADPAMKTLAQQAGMNRAGELLFLGTHPQYVDDSQIPRLCGAKISSDGYIEQGCYLPNSNKIYLRRMPNDLHDVAVVTAAHEMLHVAFNDYDSSERQKLGSALSSEQTSLNNSDLNDVMDEYARAEPGSSANELHSLIGSEYGDISSDLETHYALYFTDRSLTVAANNRVVNQFKQDETLLKQYANNIDSGKAQADSLYASSVRAARAGNAYLDDYYYNKYSQEIDYVNSQVNAYNTLLQQYNLLVAEYNGQQLPALQDVQSSGQ